MPTNTCDGDLRVRGTLTADAFTAPAGSVNNGAVIADTAIEQEKLEHREHVGTDFGVNQAGAVPATETRQVLIAERAGTIESFVALLDVCGTAGSVDFDLKKNGTSVLSAAVNIDNADTDGTPESGTISTAAFVANDVIEITLTNNSSTGATGPFAQFSYSYSGQNL